MKFKLCLEQFSFFTNIPNHRFQIKHFENLGFKFISYPESVLKTLDLSYEPLFEVKSLNHLIELSDTYGSIRIAGDLLLLGMGLVDLRGEDCGN